MCGFIGYTGESEVGTYLKLGLSALQHRGQDSAGMAVFDGISFKIHKDLGLASSVLENIDFNVKGAGIAHVRYSTRGNNTREDAQPFFARQPGVIMTHNGNLINHNEINEYLKSRSVFLSSSCDIEPFLYIFSDKLMSRKGAEHNIDDLVFALKETFKIVRGSYSVAFVLNIDNKPSLVCVRDPYGIRPAFWGTTSNNSYVCASESTAMDVIGAKCIGSIKPGTMMLFRYNEPPLTYDIEVKESRACVFEDIYFARPDTYSEDGVYIYTKRIKLGQALSKEIIRKNIKADVVIPIPDTSQPAALALAEEINIPFRQGFIKNRYTGRTFIMPSQYSRENELKLKLNPIISEIEHKDILLVDDSIVRGTTLKRVVKMLKNHNVKKIHLAIHCPPVINPCFYGIDMSIREDLYAYQILKKLNIEDKTTLDRNNLDKLEAAMAEDIGVASLSFLSIELLDSLYGNNKCSACFDGKYCVQLTDTMVQDIRCNRIASLCK